MVPVPGTTTHHGVCFGTPYIFCTSHGDSRTRKKGNAEDLTMCLLISAAKWVD